MAMSKAALFATAQSDALRDYPRQNLAHWQKNCFPSRTGWPCVISEMSFAMITIAFGFDHLDDRDLPSTGLIFKLEAFLAKYPEDQETL